MLYNGNLKCVCWYGEKFIVGKIYECKEGIINNNKDTNIKYNEYTHAFEKVKPDKIELLSKNGFELINGNFRYYLYLETNINKFNELEIYYRYDNNERIIHQIRWGKVYNTTFNDIKSVLDALNIEIIEAPKYTIDSSKEYTEEEMLKLSELGVKFKEI